MAKRILGTTALVCGLVLTAGSAAHAVATESFSFDMLVSSGAASCLPNATATVTLTSLHKASVEKMVVKANGLPPKTDFDFFVIQVPNNLSVWPGIRGTLRPMARAKARRPSSGASKSRRSSLVSEWQTLPKRFLTRRSLTHSRIPKPSGLMG
jgi:hypothetical protein